MKKLLVSLVICVVVLISGIVIAGQFPQIYNTTLAIADTEYSQYVTGVKKFTIQCQTAYDVRIAFATGYVATPTAPYETIKAGAAYWEDDVIFDGTLYFATDEAGVVVETTVWR